MYHDKWKDSEEVAVAVALAVAALAIAFLPHDDTPTSFEKDPNLRKRSNNEVIIKQAMGHKHKVSDISLCK